MRPSFSLQAACCACVIANVVAVPFSQSAYWKANRLPTCTSKVDSYVTDSYKPETAALGIAVSNLSIDLYSKIEQNVSKAASAPILS
jgi:hypothetical protein